MLTKLPQGVLLRVGGEAAVSGPPEMPPAPLPATGTNTTALPTTVTGQVIQSVASGAQCEEYQRQQAERVSRDQEVRRLGSELQNLQTRYQNAMQQALEAQQRENVNAGNTGLKGIGAVAGLAAGIDRLRMQKYQAEAQSLQLQINQKQSQISTAQTSLLSLPLTAMPPGCGANRTSPPIGASPATAASIREEVETIRSGKYAPMPSAQRATANVQTFPGRTTMNVKNSTAYELSVFFDGPISTKMTILPGASQVVDLAPGAFHVAGRVAAANVLPFYGDETYADSARYSLTFYIAP